MQFYDEVKIEIKSGKGWDGLASGRRESGVPFGGPNGGDGGNGGSIVFLADENENTLLPYKYRKIFKANNGENGRTKDQYGANGESTILKVPVGTLVKNEKWDILKQMTTNGEKRTALKGGEWGKWNIHFKNAVNQFPNFALLGEPWQEKNVILELQLLADVALVGTPSVWKSSLINSVSHTKAKVADYPFTTLVPNLGSIQSGDYHFNMIDIPGLIQWAADGKWLGNAFLRHILKARVFCFVADLDRLDKWINDVSNLLEEIVEYSKNKFGDDVKIHLEENDGYLHLIAKKDEEIIFDKIILFVLNKYDLLNDEEILKEYKNELLKNINKFCKKELNLNIKSEVFEKNIFVVSAATHFGLENWTKHLMSILKNTKTVEVEIDKMDDDFEERETDMISDITDQEKEKLLEDGYIDEINSKYAKVREINNPEFCKMVFILPWGNDEAESWFWNMIEEKWFLAEFEKEWIRKWDVLKIKSYYAGKDDKYILY